MEFRKICLVCMISLVLIGAGVIVIDYYDESKLPVIPGFPEGYQEPSAKVEKLKIDESVSEYYDDNIELVAFGPGSGWVKLKTRDGLSPVLSFKGITEEEIKTFNRFSKGIGLPVRAVFTDNVLLLTAGDHEDVHSVQVADIAADKIGINSIMNKGFREDNKPTRLVLHRDNSGKVRLVSIDKLKDMAPDQIDEDQDLFMAKRENEQTEKQ